MRRRSALPRQLGERFTVRQAAAAGVGRSRRDAADLHRPFYGIRAAEPPNSFRTVVDCYRPRLKPGQFFGGRTAMRLWGVPHPRRWTPEEPLEVLVPPHGAPPRTAGVRGRRLSPERFDGRTLMGVDVVDPVAAVFTSAAELTVVQAVVAFDALFTTASAYPGLGPGRPMATREAVEEKLRVWGRFPGSGTLRAALPKARDRVESPKETETRLLIVAGGLPEPVVQFEVRDGGRFLARVDLAYPELRIAVEYEGDGHRTDREQWRIDIRRQRDLEHRGWLVIRLTELDLRDGTGLIERLRGAIAARRA